MFESPSSHRATRHRAQQPGAMASFRTDAIPTFSEDCIPPTVTGTAALATALMRGTDLPTLAGRIAALDPDVSAQLFDAAILTQFHGRRAEALDLQQTALAASPIFRVRQDNPADDAIRLVALVAPGDLMMNTPLDFITNHLNVRLDLLFLVPGRPLPDLIPDHDVMFFAASEAEPETQLRMERLFQQWPRPALNDPSLLPALRRDGLAQRLADIPEICSPPTSEISRDRLLCELSDRQRYPGLEPEHIYPVLIRPLGSHAGTGLAKLDDDAALAAYLATASDASYYLTNFIDYRAADGLHRKYRIAFIAGRPSLCHMATSAHWMVHYLNAGMEQSAEKRAAEADAMAHFDTAFAARHATAFAALQDRLGFDYFSIDCAELPDGRLLVFEADTAAIIHAMDPADLYPYKPAHMQAAFEAFGAMLRTHAALPTQGSPS